MALNLTHAHVDDPNINPRRATRTRRSSRTPPRRYQVSDDDYDDEEEEYVDEDVAEVMRRLEKCDEEGRCFECMRKPRAVVHARERARLNVCVVLYAADLSSAVFSYSNFDASTCTRQRACTHVHGHATCTRTHAPR